MEQNWQENAEEFTYKSGGVGVSVSAKNSGAFWTS